MRKGFSLLEMLVVITILGVLAALVIPRLTGHATSAKTTGCRAHKAMIEVQAQLWRRHQGAWPAANLGNIGADSQYFPDGLPTCPVDGSAYQIDAATGKVVGHAH